MPKKSDKPAVKSAGAAKKSSSSKSSRSSQSKPENNSTKRKSIGRWLLSTGFKLGLFVLCFLVIYVVYLDAKVREKFEGQRWQVPVQVFSRAELLSAGEPLSLTYLAKSLTRGGYQKVSKVWRPGQFALSSSRIIIFQPEFSYRDQEFSAARLTIDIANGKVIKVYHGNSLAKSVTLAPQLVARIIPSSKEDRVLVGLEQVPEALLDTLLLVEDRDFYFHSGVSPLGILRALYSNIVAGRTVQGGSTLTQQLVKNMYLTREKTIVRKVNEALMALLLEYRYSKDQLLEAYVNEVYLGQHFANGVYGFGLASEFYFGRSLNQLTPAQMALLIGVIKGPSYYDPWRKPDNSRKRRDLVLKLMVEHHLIDVPTYEQAMAANLGIRGKRRMTRQHFYNYMQLVKRELPELLGNQQQNAGIKVFTGFSMKAQLLLEQTTAQTLSELERKHKQSALQAAAMVTESSTGEIMALVGDRNIDNNGFNRALDAHRPIGSLIKPAVYLPALERYQQFNFASPIEDKPITLGSEQGKEWRPKNYDGKFRGQVPLIDGLVESLNIPTVNLGMSLGLDNVVQSMAMLGYEKPLTERPSMLLGAVNMSPYQINQLYLPIANQGYYERTHAITHVVAHNGETLWQYRPRHEQRISSQSAYLMNYALQQVTERGTAKSLSWRLKGAEVAGKTGTTNDQRDSWFVGYDQEQLITSWIGHDDNKPMQLTGSSGALVLFANYLKQAGVNNLNWPVPNDVKDVGFELTSGNAVEETCQQMAYYPAVTIGLSYSNCMEKIVDKRSWLEKLFGRDEG
ncbi:penicillin-binding protein 1B [Thalassotalea euphylliae]|uniref:Penicillin-binding protein 1B n=1 Tax=Thalassotalea euphylliae TaxID=1655234 RepID=A0A3E0UM89_9GAMM|nr:penicillin-binding protein 1B [Thalassotalea euphylliae]REL36832.1 penicillin-binding protein 1B [Thalassotalea euphylliae]